ncbi:unnamed protein product [Trichobilharzia szidati]|nr:unnamed protein product [Trichobilharzia szidati]
METSLSISKKCDEVVESTENDILERISEASAKSSTYLDLSSSKLKEIPSQVLNISNLQKLYLANNCLEALTPEILKSLSHLRWLDLRDNCITNIPPEIKYLENLQTLLLDNNKITILPVELGFLEKLSVLHHRNNPIEFPPADVLVKGPKYVLKYLHDCYLVLANIAVNKDFSLCKHSSEKTEEKPKSENGSTPDKQSHCIDGETTDLEISALTKSTNEINLQEKDSIYSGNCMASLSPIRLQQDYLGQLSSDRPSSVHLFETDKVEREGSLNNSVNLEDSTKQLRKFNHLKLSEAIGSMLSSDKSLYNNSEEKDVGSSCRRTTQKSKLYKKIERSYLKSKRYGSKSHSASLLSRLPSQSDRHTVFLPEDPPQPTLEKIRILYKQEKRKRARKELLLRQDASLQRLKDAMRISDWRDDYTEYQKQKLREYLTKSHSEIKKESDERIFGAPFDVQGDQLSMINNNELRVLRERPIRKKRPMNLDADIVFQLEMASLERDNQLTQQVHKHTKDILERFKLPIIPTHDTIRSEMLIAKKSLDAAVRLHRRVQQRLETLGYFHGSNRRDLW